MTRIIYKHHRNLKNNGFTLVELVIVLAVLIAIVAMSIGPSVRLIRWMKETDNKDKILNLSKGIEAVYKNNSWTVDESDSSTFIFKINGISYTLSNGLSTAAENSSALKALASTSNLASNTIEYDAMRNVLQVYVSDRLTDINSSIKYHVIAIVSPGWDSTLNSAFNISSGELTLSGDDTGFLISGFQIQQENMAAANKILENVRDTYQNYFTSLYLNDTNRNVYINRFSGKDTSCAAGQWWDSSSLIDNSVCFASATATNVGLKSALGLSHESVTTPWGRELLVDNGSASSRNPDTVGLIIPYTARLLAEVPWGANIEITVTGNY
jgi:Tfp pilus assembly protein PilE